MNFKAQNAIGTYSVILTMNPKVVDKLIGSEFVHDLDEIATSRDTSFYTSRDSNFIEFTNEFAFGDTADSGKETAITLKMHDEGLNFLKRFHYEGMGKTLSVFRDAKYKDIANEAESLSSRAEELEILREGERTNVEQYTQQINNSNFVSNIVSVIGVGPNATAYDLLEAAEKKVDEYTSELTKIYNKLDIFRSKLGQKGFPKVYIAYGVGTDIRDWAGPIECYLGDIQYDNNGKKETTTYKFLVHVLTASYQSLNPGFSDKAHRSNTLLGWSTPLVAYKEEYGLRGVNMKRIDFTSFSKSIHDAIVRLLSGYLYKNGIKNHLIVLPDLDSLLLPLIQECFDKYLKSIGVNPWRPDGGYNPNFQSTPYIDTFLGGRARFEQPGENKGPYTNWVESIFADELKTGVGILNSDINVLQAIINQLFTRLGIHVAKSESRTASTDPAVPIKSINNFTSAGYRPGGVDPSEDIDVSAQATTAFAFGGAGGYNNQEIFDPFTGDKIEGADFGWYLQFPWFSERTAPGNTEGGIDILAPIRLLFRDMEQSSGETILDFEAFWENNTRIKKKFFEKFGGGTYYGYSGEPGPDTDDPFLIIGDAQTIRLFLYGEVDWEKNDTQSLAERRIQLNDFHVPQNITFSQSLKDRFWTAQSQDLQDIGQTASYVTSFGRSSWYDQILDVVLSKVRHNGFFESKHTVQSEDYGTGNARDPMRSAVMTMLPDEFATAADGSFWADRLLKLAVPVFKANTRNANITEYKFDASKWMMAQFFGVFEEVWYNQYERFVTGELPDTTSMTSDEIRNKILVIMDRYTIAGSTGLPDLSWAISPGMQTDIGELSNNLCDLLYLEGAGMYTSIDKGSAGLALNYVLLFKSLFESVFIGTMKTLPMFHLSHAHIHTRPALVFLKSTRRVSPIKKFTGTYNSSDFFSGVYRILGYKHTISTKNAFSQFLVHRDIVGDIKQPEI